MQPISLVHLTMMTPKTTRTDNDMASASQWLKKELQRQREKDNGDIHSPEGPNGCGEKRGPTSRPGPKARRVVALCYGIRVMVIDPIPSYPLSLPSTF